MSGFMSADGSALIGGLLPTGVGEALQLDALGNLRISGAGSDTSTTGVVQNNNDAVTLAIPGGLATALAQTVMANSAPVVLASDEIVPMNLKQVNGAALSASNPSIVEHNVQNWIRQGQGFNGTSGTSSTAGAINAVEFSLFNPAASGKNVYV